MFEQLTTKKNKRLEPSPTQAGAASPDTEPGKQPPLPVPPYQPYAEDSSLPKPLYQPYAEDSSPPKPLYKPYAEQPSLHEPLYEPYKGI
jgi:hypothetical protein